MAEQAKDEFEDIDHELLDEQDKALGGEKAEKKKSFMMNFGANLLNNVGSMGAEPNRVPSPVSEKSSVTNKSDESSMRKRQEKKR